VLATGRAENARRLAAIPGVVAPRIVALPRTVLEAPDAAVYLAAQNFTFPLLLRSPGFHTGRNFELVESAHDLPTTTAKLPGETLLVIDYLDARDRDGRARKFRVMIVNGRLYPLHLAISSNWKVHYFTADMADASHRTEEAAFLADMPAVLGTKAMHALERIRQTLNLEYGGIDFGSNAAGEVLLFEANATMVVNPPDADARFGYRAPAITNILEAVKSMLIERAVLRVSH
jgi:glutathione synthase/RimK-type ligase-like ATP-grasp enzyme